MISWPKMASKWRRATENDPMCSDIFITAPLPNPTRYKRRFHPAKTRTNALHPSARSFRCFGVFLNVAFYTAQYAGLSVILQPFESTVYDALSPPTGQSHPFLT